MHLLLGDGVKREATNTLSNFLLLKVNKEKNNVSTIEN